MPAPAAAATAPITAPAEGTAPSPAGAEGASSPAAPTESPAAAEAKKESTRKEKMARAVALFRGETPGPKLVGPGNAPDKSVDTAPANDEGTEPESQVEAADKPADKKPEPEPKSAKEEAENVRAVVALRKAEAANLQLKQAHQAALDKLTGEREADRKTLADLQTKFEVFAKDPIAALKAAGMTPDQFMRDVANGKIKPATPEDDLREQVTAKLSPIEQELADLKKRLADKEEAEQKVAAEAKAKQNYERDLEAVKKLVPAEQYPVTAALGAYAEVLKACYRNNETSAEAVAERAAEFEAHQVQLLETLFTPQVLAALEKRSPKLRETVKALRGNGQSRQPADSSGGPRGAARDVVSAPTNPVARPKTPAEKMARAKARLFEGQGQ